MTLKRCSPALLVVLAGAAANASDRDGVAVFTASKTGLMYEASVGGQKFTFHPLAAAK